MRTRVKFCGIMRREDAIQAVRLGADAIGLVFYPESPRAVSPQQAYQIVRGLPPFVTVVGLFVNAASHYLQQILNRVPIDILQFHGEESPEDCSHYGRAYIKAIRMAEGVDLPSLARAYESASALLLDTYQAGVPGGTGRAFDWKRVPKNFSKAVILAGGLTPENIAQAVMQVRPYAVDVSGGVERSKGVKDAAKMVAFMRGIDSVN